MLPFREMGPDVENSRLFFGHKSAAPTGNLNRELDVTRDLKEGNMVAIRMHDEDARSFGRRFDIAIIKDVHCSATARKYSVQYYKLEGGAVGQYGLQDKQFFASESVAVNGVWKEGREKGVVEATDILCETWVVTKGKQKGHLHDEARWSLEVALDDIDCLDMGTPLQPRCDPWV